MLGQPNDAPSEGVRNHTQSALFFSTLLTREYSIENICAAVVVNCVLLLPVAVDAIGNVVALDLGCRLGKPYNVESSTANSRPRLNLLTITILARSQLGVIPFESPLRDHYTEGDINPTCVCTESIS